MGSRQVFSDSTLTEARHRLQTAQATVSCNGPILTVCRGQHRVIHHVDKRSTYEASPQSGTSVIENHMQVGRKSTPTAKDKATEMREQHLRGFTREELTAVSQRYRAGIW